MLIRNCSGGVIFYGDKVFLIKTEKNEWTLPKGKIKEDIASSEVALRRVKEETGIDAVIVSNAGQTSYEFFSVTRQKPVFNKITWYIMKTQSEDFKLADYEKIVDGGFFDIEEAMEKITYSQDKSIVNLSYRKYKENE